jgi:hypothetical protein
MNSAATIFEEALVARIGNHLSKDGISRKRVAIMTEYGPSGKQLNASGVSIEIHPTHHTGWYPVVWIDYRPGGIIDVMPGPSADVKLITTQRHLIYSKGTYSVTDERVLDLIYADVLKRLKMYNIRRQKPRVRREQ